MKILCIQSHSKNNQFLYNYTIDNHIQYCNMHEINFLSTIQDYNIFCDVDKIKNFLGYFDVVFTIGSDCLFTNMSKNIIDFIDLQKNMNICQQGLGLSYVNGQINFFKKGSQKFLDFINLIQKNNQNIEYGFQGIINGLYIYMKDIFEQNINVIQKGSLQKYVFNQRDYIIRRQYCNEEDIKMVLWNKGDFLLHTLGSSNQEKFQLLKHFKETNKIR